MSNALKNEGPVIVGFLCAIIMIANYFISNPMIKESTSLIRNNASLISAFAAALGAVNLINVNYKYYETRKKNLWYVAPIYLILFPLISILGIMRHPTYNWIYTNINVPIMVALTAFIGFFLMQGVYRTLRVRNVETLLVAVGLFAVILRKAPIGSLIWTGFVPIGDWFLFTAGVGTVRSLIIVFGFGVVSMGLRTILGYERTHIGILAEAGEEE